MVSNFLAYDLALKLYRKCEAMSLKHHIKDQLQRAAQSVVLNLAEGSAKPSPKEKVRFYAIAFGSIREVQAIFDLAGADEESADLADHIAACIYKLVYKRRP